MKRVIFGVVLSSVAVYAFAGRQHTAKSEPEAFKEIKKLVGGVWRGTVGEGMPVEMRYKLEDGDKVVVGEATVGDPKKPVLSMKSRMGIDAATNEVYYLDMHGSDTVYFGHFTMKGGEVVLDFKGIASDTGHYISRQKMIANDTYQSTLWVVDAAGQEKELHKLELKRTK